ncbi:MULTISPECIES: UDP-galactopyranose mutase [unclassified Paenibacillus]|uniref:UDP-galactopyranose mutase n=1 Tax=unclassified Paenibacillus TaxID=185978 RepID=UPI001AE4202D|nr:MULTISPECIES: UDP-galactopyranose mutase [unclassified Paenibacillus]MBP1156664.1 UDP-galactopyranose mutase [Paenibacillus sp. PvP091]MBP1172598.1 UDP-galactopyranose mutase [Paenibacillus sp. PvR098]MBP2438978.1 UDP-galactopyranose mutase [Paenibacillus sp. PvP052]
MTIDFLIVGAGFSGCVLARELAEKLDKRVLVVDTRNHIGGNAYDCYDDAGILIQPYGPHIFHTNSKMVFDYLSQYTEWILYEHRVLAQVDGRKVPIPINLDTINELYGLRCSEKELSAFYDAVRQPVDHITNSEDIIISKVGVELYDKFFKHYTKKQWDLWPSELDSSVCARIPVRTNRDPRYFTDKYQVMPKRGYTRMFQRIIDHPNIQIMLQTDYKQISSIIPHRYLIYSGPIDTFFDYKFGKLPYRSLNFTFETLDQPLFQEVGVVNYPMSYDFTRITEFKHITGQQHPRTTILYEYPSAEGDPYYPIPREENNRIYQLYKQEAEQLENVWFVGRLGTYKYYNMDQVVAQALTLFESKLRNLL